MPNWCNSDYTFKGNKDEIKEFHEKLKLFTSTKRVPNGFGNSWLGNIVDGFGFNWNDKNIPCRGLISYISDLELNDNTGEFNIFTETAWTYMNEMWDAIINEYYPSISYVFIAEEPGSEIYVNTDLEGYIYPTRFIVYLELPPKYNEIIEFYADDEDNLLRDLNIVFHRKFKSIKQCKKRLRKEFRKKKYRNKGYYVKIYKFEETA